MMTIRFEGAGPKVQGFSYLWAKRVTGFDSREHCARCLVGPYIKAVSPGMATGSVLVAPEGEPFVYLCGVATSRRWTDNLHLALRPVAGGLVETRTYRGERIVVEGAEQVAIPELPAGFRNLGPAFTTCRNFCFGVAQYKALSPLGTFES